MAARKERPELTVAAVLGASGLPHRPSGHRWGHWVDVLDDEETVRVHVDLPEELLSPWAAGVAADEHLGPLPDDPAGRMRELLLRLADLLHDACTAGVSPPAEVALVRLASGQVSLTVLR